jgi:ribose transport system ATP-binding protein
LSKTGLSVVYISHHLHEVFEVANRVTVLKDGQVVATHLTKEVTEDVLVREMVGRTLERKFTGGKSSKHGGGYALEVQDLKKDPSVSEFSIKVRQGEIVGIAGLVGAGRTEALRLIAGLDRAESGSVKVAGKSLQMGSVTRAISQGVVYVTEDRRSDGLFIQKTIWENLRSRDIAGTFSNERVSLQKAREQACLDIEHFGVVTASEEQSVSHLSGGNQQKVLLASRLNFEPAVLLIDEPTRGVDVGAREQIYGLLRSLADAGMAIVVASSDLLEIRSLCDRVLVMRAGRIIGELESDQLDEEQIMILATGTKERADQL